MALRTETLTVGNLDLDCHYYIEKDINWNKEEVIVENIFYKGIDVTELICEIDIEFKVKLEEMIYENL